MGDNNLVPISDEQAKALQEIVKALGATGGWFADILGDLPKDLLALLIGDRVKLKRAERVAVLVQQMRKRLQDRGIPELEPPSLKYAIPILQAAADEENEELQDLWSRLLAAAMDPNRRDSMRQSFIQAVKQLDPLDALVLKAIRANGQTTWSPNGRDVIAGKLGCSTDEVVVSLKHLADLDCIMFTDSTGPRIQPYMKSFGTLLMNVVRD